MKPTQQGEGIGIDYDHHEGILQLTVSRRTGQPVFLILPRADALRFVKAILDAMGVGSNLIEIDVPPKEKRN